MITQQMPYRFARACLWGMELTDYLPLGLGLLHGKRQEDPC